MRVLRCDFLKKNPLFNIRNFMVNFLIQVLWCNFLLKKHKICVFNIKKLAINFLMQVLIKKIYEICRNVLFNSL